MCAGLYWAALTGLRTESATGALPQRDWHAFTWRCIVCPMAMSRPRRASSTVAHSMALPPVFSTWRKKSRTACSRSRQPSQHWQGQSAQQHQCAMQNPEVLKEALGTNRGPARDHARPRGILNRDTVLRRVLFGRRSFVEKVSGPIGALPAREKLKLEWTVTYLYNVIIIQDATNAAHRSPSNGIRIQWKSPLAVSTPCGGSMGVSLNRWRYHGTKMCSIHGRLAGGMNEK